MEKNMEYNFKMLEKRVFESLELSDLKKIKKILNSIDEPTICVGVGGSNIVAEYLSKVLAKKNNIIAITKEPRDLLYEDLKQFKNIIACSYSGNNYGVDISFNNLLNKYLITNNDININGVKSIVYKSNLPKEKSFISLASSLMPMAIILNYYLDGNNENIYDSVDNYDYSNDLDKSEVYEIITGKDTSSAGKFLESTFVEAGIAIPILHDKYSFCHGRTTLSYSKDNSLIYFNRYKEIDEIILEDAKKYYRNTIILNGNYSDPIVDDFNLTVKSMFLAKAIAEKKNVDLSGVDYSPLVKKLYYYKGQL